MGSGGTTNDTGGSAAGGLVSGGNSTGGRGPVTIGHSELPAPPGSDDLPAPSGAVGGLTVLNWAGFKGAVSYTFDDANSSQIAHYDELQALSVPFTFYIVTGKAEATSPVWARAVTDGHEIANHTKSHLSAGTGEDIDAATEFIQQKLGVDVWTMAAPNGAAIYTDLAKPRFFINRGVANGLIAANDNTDPFTLFCYIPPTGALASAFNTQIDGARAAGKWRVVLVHGFTGGTDNAYQPIALEEFVSSVEYAKSLGDLWLDSVVNVGAYWRGQKAFSQATVTTSGDEQTYTWTLPAHFPPDRYLRVTVEGGTLRQGDVTLEWNGHGYYEVALDAGSLTLSP